MSFPIAVNTADGTCWTRRGALRGGEALYAPEGVCSCPEFVMATLAELAEHGIVGSADVLPMPAGPEPEVDDHAKAPWGRGEDGRPLLPMGAHWTDVPEVVDRWVAKIQARVDEAKPGPWYRAPATELGVTPGTVRTHIDGYPRMVGQFTNLSPADLEMVLYAGSDLRWCLEMIAKFRTQAAELEGRLRVAEDLRVRALGENDALRKQLGDAGRERDTLRERVAELEAERHTTNEALSDAAEQLRTDRDRIAELEAAPVGGGYPPSLPWAKHMDADDLEGFLADLVDAASGDDDLSTLAAVEDAIGRWRVIGEAQHAHNTAPGPDAAEAGEPS